MSIVTIGFGMGIAVGPSLAGVLAVVFFKLPFLAVGFLSLLGAWIVLKYVSEIVHGKRALLGNHT